MTIIHTTMDYFAAVAERQHLEKLLEVGTRQFRDYGLELFQSSMRNKISRLSATIEQFEVCSGYTELAPYNFWSSRIRTESLEVGTGLLSEESSILNSSNGVSNNSRDVQKIPGDIIEQMITIVSGTLSPTESTTPRQTVFGFANVPCAESH